MKTQNIIKHKILSTIKGFKNRLIKNALIENAQHQEEVVLNETETFLFQTNEQEDEFLFI